MTLTKKNIIEKVRDVLDRAPKKIRFRKYHVSEPNKQYGLSRQKCQKSVESLIEIMKSTLEKGEDVLISGFGKFKVNEKKKRKGRNPSNGSVMMLKKRRIVTFQCSSKLRRKINDSWADLEF